MPRAAARSALTRLGTAGLVVVIAEWARRLLVVRRSVDRFARYWNASGEAPPGSFVLAALGDSSAQGIGSSSPDRGWVGLVAEHLRRAGRRDVHVVNLSRSGAVVADVLSEQLPQLPSHNPDLVVVGIGGNDVLGRWDAATFASEVDELVAALPASSVVADVPYFMHGEWQRRAAAAAAIVRESAHRRDIPVAEVHEAMRAYGWWAMLNHYSADFFHPNDRGYAVWAEAFTRRLPAP